MEPFCAFIDVGVLRQDYVRTARGKGLVERIVIMKHALRNALIPFVTILVLQIPGSLCRCHYHRNHLCLAGHGVYISMRSTVPTGQLPWLSSLLLGALTVLATLLGDILYTIVDRGSSILSFVYLCDYLTFLLM